MICSRSPNWKKTMPDTVSPYDTGVWLALAFASHPFYAQARSIFERADSSRPAAFCRATQTSFLRLLTTPTICNAYGSSLITNSEAGATCEELWALPQVVWLAESAGMDAEWRQCAALGNPSPKVWLDAYLAAFAIRGDLNFVRLDKDFSRFRGRGLELEFLSVGSKYPA
jgi:toxin-antitoxin system PIN domain toxin